MQVHGESQSAVVHPWVLALGAVSNLVASVLHCSSGPGGTVAVYFPRQKSQTAGAKQRDIHDIVYIYTKSSLDQYPHHSVDGVLRTMSCKELVLGFENGPETCGSMVRTEIPSKFRLMTYCTEALEV